jgi:regulator of sigma E protease
VLLNTNQPIPVQLDRHGQQITKTVVPVTTGADQVPEVGWVPEQPNIVTAMESDMPAAKAGIRLGDNITAVNGQSTNSIPAMYHLVQENKDKPAQFTVIRNGQTLQFTMAPKLVKAENGSPSYRIGIASDPRQVDKLPFAQALSHSLEMNKKYSLLLFELVRKMFSNRSLFRQVSGPIEIARESGEFAQQPGWTPLLQFMAAISLNLGIFNLFPFPILDGGMILMLAIEGLRRRDISLSVKERIYQVAFVMLVVFAVLVIFNDISKFPVFNRLP